MSHCARTEIIRECYIRVCVDSGHGLEATQAAQLAAATVRCHPLDVLVTLGMDNMNRIADGTHPVLRRRLRSD